MHYIMFSHSGFGHVSSFLRLEVVVRSVNFPFLLTYFKKILFSDVLCLQYSKNRFIPIYYQT